MQERRGQRSKNILPNENNLLPSLSLAHISSPTPCCTAVTTNKLVLDQFVDKALKDNSKNLLVDVSNVYLLYRM